MTQLPPIPAQADVVIIGGGPAGSSAAALMARAGLDVVLLDKARFPRPNIGESILPHFWKFADKTGVAEKVAKENFLPKSGGLVVWDGKIREVNFSKFGYGDRPGLHVERDRFDEILLRHASDLGARVFEEVSVRQVPPRDQDWMTVHYDDLRGGGARPGAIRCRYVVDASGHAGVVASLNRARRRVGYDGKYLGMWGYFRGGRFIGVDREVYPPEDMYRVKPVTFVVSYKDGWAWHIIMREMTSVGLVINTAAAKGMNKEAQERYFLDTCATMPYMRDLLAGAEYIRGSMAFRPDYSYYSTNITGPGYVCIGDAAAFVDPIFSQGVTAAMYNACLASWAVQASLKNPSRADFYRATFQQRVLEFYGFARLLAFGDFGGDGVDAEGVKRLVLTLPVTELALYVSAASTTSRAENVRRMVREAGIDPEADDQVIEDKSESLAALRIPAADRIKAVANG